VLEVRGVHQWDPPTYNSGLRAARTSSNRSNCNLTNWWNKCFHFVVIGISWYTHICCKEPQKHVTLGSLLLLLLRLRVSALHHTCNEHIDSYLCIAHLCLDQVACSAKPAGSRMASAVQDSGVALFVSGSGCAHPQLSLTPFCTPPALRAGCMPPRI
jgi:hypothetical protein